MRTKIRNLKVPLEKSGINYDQIIKSINNLASRRDTLDLYLNKIYKEFIKKNNKEIVIKYENFAILSDEIKMRILTKSIKNLSNSYYFRLFTSTILSKLFRGFSYRVELGTQIFLYSE